MIINEKYLMDIDDEDDDVIPSSNEFNNKKYLNYDFTVETFSGTRLLQHSREYIQQNDVTFYTLGDCVDYYE